MKNNIETKIYGYSDFFKLFLNLDLNNNVPNKFIISGRKGIGKLTFAHHLINYLLSKNEDSKYDKNNYEINIKNRSFKLVRNNTHPNFYSIDTDEGKKNIGIDQIRKSFDFINRSSFNNKCRIILINNTEYLNNNSSNALLKILEEPNNNTYFILISHQLSNILPTIRSRCIKFYFKNPSKDIFHEIIKNENIDLNNNDIDFLYLLSNGSPGTAIKISTDKMNDLYNSIIDITIPNKNDLSKKIFALSEYVSNFTNDEYKVFLMLLRFILINIIKNNLGILSEFTTFNNESFITKLISFEILEFIDNNEKDLFIYNLDKKIFCLNIFIPLKKSYE